MFVSWLRPIPLMTFIAVSSVLWLPPAEAKRFPKKWVEVRSEHFIVLTDGDEDEAKDVVRHFERVRSHLTRVIPAFANLSEPPLRVFAASSPSTFKILAPHHGKNTGPTQVSGVFRRSGGEKLIILNKVRADGDFSTVYHEFFHYLADHAELKMPPWLSEGLADFWGAGTHFTDQAVEVGKVRKERLAVLERGRRSIDLEDFFAADKGSRYYQAEKQAGLFYAQSWAMVHMMMHGDESVELREQLSTYLRMVNQGADGLETARQVFGDLDELKKKLRAYIRQLNFRFAKMPLPPEPDESAFAVQKLGRPGAAALIGRYLSIRRPVDDWQELVDLAREGEVKRAESFESQGLLERRRGNLPEALAAFESALEHEAGPMAHYGAAALAFHQAWQDGELTPGVLRGFEESLTRALAIDDRFAPAYARLSDIYRLLDDGASGRAITAMRRAVDLEPRSMTLQLKLSSLLLAAGSVDEGREVARRGVARVLEIGNRRLSNQACWRGSLWGLAESVLPACDQAVELAPESHSVLDSRAVARLASGDLEGGEADLRKALRLGGPDWSVFETRQSWLASLEAGKNPMQSGGLEALAGDPEELGLIWLY